MTYYKRAFDSTKTKNKSIANKQQSDDEQKLFQNISLEVQRQKLESFAKEIDDYCYQCLKATINFNHMHRSLLLDKDLLLWREKNT